MSSNDNMVMIETIIIQIFRLKQVENDHPMGKEREAWSRERERERRMNIN